MGLSREQLDDVLYVRQLYLTKRGLLAEARNALVAEIHAVSGSILTAGGSATKLSSLTCKLQQNAMQVSDLHQSLCCCAPRGESAGVCVYIHSMPVYTTELCQKACANLCPTALAGNRVFQDTPCSIANIGSTVLHIVTQQLWSRIPCKTLPSSA